MTQKSINMRHESTMFGGLSRSALMSRIRSAGNATTERRLMKLMRQAGITGWRRHYGLPGKPDFVFPSNRVVVFVDGCFWHGHNCPRNLRPRCHSVFWQKKILRNKQRDSTVSRKLRQLGWHVLRVWECKLGKHSNSYIRRIERSLRIQ